MDVAELIEVTVIGRWYRAGGKTVPTEKADCILAHGDCRAIAEFPQANSICHVSRTASDRGSNGWRALVFLFLPAFVWPLRNSNAEMSQRSWRVSSRVGQLAAEHN